MNDQLPKDLTDEEIGPRIDHPSGASLPFQKQVNDLQWLTACSQELIYLTGIRDILAYAGRTLQDKLPDCIVVTLLQEPDRPVLKLAGFYGLEEKQENLANRLLGLDLNGAYFAIEDRLKDVYQQRRVHRYPGSLAEFAEGVLPRRAVEKTAEMLDIRGIYTIGLKGKEKVLGNLHIFTRKVDQLENPRLVESFAHQVALALERSSLTEELQTSEAFHREIFQGTTDALIITDPEGVIIRANEVAGALYDYPADKLIGMKAEELIDLKMRERHQAIRNQAAETVRFQGETASVRRDGSTFRGEVRGKMIQVQGEQFWIISVRDVTDRQETRDELDFRRQLWESLLENTPDLVYFKDRDHRLTLCSRAYAKIFDAEPEDLIGKTALDLWPSEGNEILADERRVLNGKPLLRKERKVTNPLGEERWYSLTKMPIYQDGEINGFFAIDKDITAKKISEKTQDEFISELALINQVIVETSRLSDIDQICQLLAEHVYRVNPESYVVASLYDPDRNAISIRALEGMSEQAERISRALGAHPSDLLIEIDENPLEDDLKEIFTSGKLERVPNGLYDLTRGKIPRLVCQSVERMMGVDRIFIVGFGLEGISRGGLILFMKKGAEIQHPAAVETITSHTAVLLERLQAQLNIQKRTSQLEAFRDVEQMIISELDLEELLRVIASRAVELVQATGGGFSLYQPEQDHLDYRYHVSDISLPEDTTMKRGEGLAGLVWERREPVIVNEYGSWDGRSEHWLEALGEYAIMGVPVFWKDQFLGVLEVFKDSGGDFYPGDAEILEYFAAQSAIAIKNTRLFEQEKQKRQEAETLREVGMMMTKMIDSGRLLAIILEQLEAVLPYESASVQLLHGEELVVEAVAGRLDPEAVIGRRFSLEHDFLMKPIILEGETSVVDDVTQVESWEEFGDTTFVRSWIGVPLEIKGKVIGVMTVDHHRPGWYQEEHAQLARNFANQAAVVIENARLLEETERQAKKLAALYQSSLHISRELDPDQVLQEMGDQVQALFNPDSFLFARYDHVTGAIEIAYALAAGERKKDWEKTSIPQEQGGGLLGWIINHQQALLIDDVVQETLPVPPSRTERDIRSWLGAPLLAGDRVVGAMVVQSYQEAAFHSSQKQLLELLASQAAIAFENSRLFDQAQQRMKRIASLREVDRTISGTVDLKTTLEVLIGQLTHTLEVDAAAVLLFQPSMQTLEYVLQRGFKAEVERPDNLLLGESPAGKTALRRRLIHIQSLTEYAIEGTDYLVRQGFETYLGVPLIAKGDLVGVLEVCQRSRKEISQEWLDFLEALADQAAIAIDRLNLFNDLNRTNLELIQAYDATIEGWARAIELRDVVTEGHSRRVEEMTVKLAARMGVNEKDLAHIRRGALLHDIGKMAIPDSILLKEGKLNEEEWELMRKHPVYAYEMLSRIDFLRPALPIPYAHHERWDGSGYPRGLAGEEIPLEARIFAVVDVWDALQSDRPYRKAWSEEKTLSYLREQAGTQFDPQVVEIFLNFLQG